MTVVRCPVEDTTVADTILEQLGGHRFVVMTGARHVCAISDAALLFSLPKRSAKDGVDKVRITLTPADLYDMRFYRTKRDLALDIVVDYEGVFADQLQDLFTKATGVYTHF